MLLKIELLYINNLNIYNIRYNNFMAYIIGKQMLTVVGSNLLLSAVSRSTNSIVMNKIYGAKAPDIQEIIDTLTDLDLDVTLRKAENIVEKYKNLEVSEEMFGCLEDLKDIVKKINAEYKTAIDKLHYNKSVKFGQEWITYDCTADLKNLTRFEKILVKRIRSCNEAIVDMKKSGSVLTTRVEIKKAVEQISINEDFILIE